MSFRIYEGFSVIFPTKLLQFNVLRREMFFLIPLSITFFNLKILGFLFSTKNSLTLGVKILGNLLEELRKLHTMNGTVR